MKIKELRALTQEELLHKEKALREELFKLNEGRYSGRTDKPHLFSSIRKDIARIKTLLNSKKPASLARLSAKPMAGVEKK